MGNSQGKQVAFTDDGEHSALYWKQKSYLTVRPATVNLNHFRLLRVVGKGAFGKVRIVERKDSGLTFALKYIRKEEGMWIVSPSGGWSLTNSSDSTVVRSESVRNIIRERRMLEHLNHPFLCNLRYSFQDIEYMYDAMSEPRALSVIVLTNSQLHRCRSHEWRRFTFSHIEKMLHRRSCTFLDGRTGLCTEIYPLARNRPSRSQTRQRSSWLSRSRPFSRFRTCFPIWHFGIKYSKDWLSSFLF